MNMLLLYAKINDLPYIFYMVFVIDSLGLPDLICIHQIRKAFAVYQNHFHGGVGPAVAGSTPISARSVGTTGGNFADVANALMAIPNLVSLLLLSGVIASETKR
jgi:hypothetical protein